MIDLKKYENSDYQNRGGDYPKSNKPVSIDAYDTELVFSFKNTSEEDAIRAVKRTSEYSEIASKYKVGLSAYQDGDYHDDWVNVFLRIEKEK